MHSEAVVIGGGLAGSEAAWQLAQRGIHVSLMEMRPQTMTPAHHTGSLAELVCSNSLRGDGLDNAAGLLKEEMRRLGSLVMKCADANRVPAGSSLAVDRENFAAAVTESLTHHPNVTLARQEILSIPSEGVTIVSSGPLSSENLTSSIQEFCGEQQLYFYDAAAPIVKGESIDYKKVFRGSRYGKGGADYLNCPMNEEEYHDFYQALVTAERYPLHSFEKVIVFEGCMAVETMAGRGPQTLLFGPLKPVGFTDPETGKRPFALVQLRQDNQEGTLYNIVGFQTNLRQKEQDRILRLIPGLEQAEIVRYGKMHRNTYLNSPLILKATLQAKKREQLFFAGQITGVEGYVESASSGLIAGINASRLLQGQQPVVFPPVSAHGALCHYITTSISEKFQPMNITFGLIPPLDCKVRDRKTRNFNLSARALKELSAFIDWEHL